MEKFDMENMTTYYESEEFESKFTYTGDNLGLQFNEDKVLFRVWAPTAQKVELIIYDSGDAGDEDNGVGYFMSPDKNGTWYYQLNKDCIGNYYVYKVTFDDESTIMACDPYAKAVGINGDRGMILNPESIQPEGWDNDKSPFSGKNITDAVIYEVHVRDFTIDKSVKAKNSGKFLGFVEEGLKNSFGQSAGIDYLKELGITHVHLLPVADYGSVDEKSDGGYNWGYDPKNYNVPEGSYSTDPYDGKSRILELKTMIKKLHDNGIGVIMDVVYNHTYKTDYCFNRIVPGYFYRFDENGDYSDGSGCGNDVASERSMVRKFISDSVKYWAKEYHFDGFRFDLMGLLDVDTMKSVRQAVDIVNPEIIIYGEGWDLKTSTLKKDILLAKQENTKYLDRIAMFNDDFRDAIKGSVFLDDETGYISNNMQNISDIIDGVTASPKWSSSPTEVINFISCHDNNTLFDKIEIGNKGITFDEKVRQNKLAALIEFTCQGAILIHAGEEILRTKKGEDGLFISDSVRAGDEVNSIKWDNLGKKEYYNVYEYYKGLIEFRKKHVSFRMTNRKDILDNIKFIKTDDIIEFMILSGNCGDESDKILVIYNPSDKDIDIKLPEGEWKVCGDYDSIEPEGKYNVTGNVIVPYVSGMILIS